MWGITGVTTPATGGLCGTQACSLHPTCGWRSCQLVTELKCSVTSKPWQCRSCTCGQSCPSALLRAMILHGRGSDLCRRHTVLFVVTLECSPACGVS